MMFITQIYYKHEQNKMAESSSVSPAPSKGPVVHEIPTTDSLGDFVNSIRNLHLPTLITYQGNFTGEDVTKFLQDGFDDKNITVTLENIFGTTYCVKYHIETSKNIVKASNSSGVRILNDYYYNKSQELDDKTLNEIVTTYDGIKIPVKSLSVNQGLYEFAKRGSKEGIEYFISQAEKFKKQYDWSFGMAGAALGGHLDLVHWFVSKGADQWNYGMCKAANGGHKSIVDFMISKGANQWNSGLEYAALGGHLDLVNLFVSKGADQWNNPMAEAARGGHLDLVKFFVSKGANKWNFGLCNAVMGGHRNIVDFMISNGASDFVCALAHATSTNNRELIDFLTRKINFVEKYIHLCERAKDVYKLDGNAFYPDICTMHDLFPQNGQKHYALKILFNPKTDMITLDGIPEIECPRDGDIIVKAPTEKQPPKRILNTSAMSTCIDGYVEKFISLNKYDRDKYGIGFHGFQTKEGMQKALDEQPSSLPFSCLKIMFKIDDISEFEPRQSKSHADYYLTA